MIDKLRKSTGRQRLILKAAFDQALDRAGGPENFQYETRVNVGTLSKYSSPHDPMFPPVDVCLDADLKARDPVLLRALASAEGYDIAPRRAGTEGRAWSVVMGELAREAGELVAAIGEASADKGIDTAEAAEVLAEAYQLKRALDALIGELDQIQLGEVGAAVRRLTDPKT